MTANNPTKAMAYYRTSSASNVGANKDTLTRQELSVSSFAKTAGYEIVSQYYDAAVSGTDDIMDRPEFARMVADAKAADVSVILVESASRFARDYIVQMTGYELLVKAGIQIIPTDSPSYFTEDTPTAIMIRQILAAVSGFERNSLVTKLRAARDRKRAATGRCEGRKPVPASHVEAASALADTGMTLAAIAQAMQERGMVSVGSGRRYGPQSIKCMLKGRYRTVDVARLAKERDQPQGEGPLGGFTSASLGYVIETIGEGV